jgi:hypothetical protein
MNRVLLIKRNREEKSRLEVAGGIKLNGKLFRVTLCIVQARNLAEFWFTICVCMQSAALFYAVL